MLNIKKMTGSITTKLEEAEKRVLEDFNNWDIYSCQSSEGNIIKNFRRHPLLRRKYRCMAREIGMEEEGENVIYLMRDCLDTVFGFVYSKFSLN